MEKRIENLTGCLAIALEKIDKMAKVIDEGGLHFDFKDLNEFVRGEKLKTTLETENAQ